MTLRAYAKINLGLRILHKRPDGYHEIETVFRQIDNYDLLHLTLLPKGISMETKSPDVPADSTNLCVQASELLRDITHVQRGVHIELEKNIPVGAGLGGGSSDAAAVLKGLVKLWDLALRPHELKRIALNLGSDVPFFLEGGCAYATGRGETLEHVRLGIPFWILVVTPHIAISTSWAYNHVKIANNLHPKNLRSILSSDFSAAPEISEHLRNDFEPLIFETYPEVKSIRDMLVDEGAAFVSLCGSGSSMFGFFPDEEAANIAALKFSKSYYTSLTAPSFLPETTDRS